MRSPSVAVYILERGGGKQREGAKERDGVKQNETLLPLDQCGSHENYQSNQVADKQKIHLRIKVVSETFGKGIVVDLQLGDLGENQEREMAKY